MAATLNTKNETSDVLYQLVRVTNRTTGRPTTLSIDPVIYIHLCRHLRSLGLVNALVRQTAATLELVPDKTLSGQVNEALATHLVSLKRQAA